MSGEVTVSIAFRNRLARHLAAGGIAVVAALGAGSGVALADAPPPPSGLPALPSLPTPPSVSPPADPAPPADTPQSTTAPPPAQQQTPVGVAPPQSSSTSAPVAHPAPGGPKCTITGTAHDDVLHGTRHRDVICGLGGDDVLLGRGGDDDLLGGSGRDRLVGGRGADRLDGGSGHDRLEGGPGRDTALSAGHDHLLAVERRGAAGHAADAYPGLYWGAQTLCQSEYGHIYSTGASMIPQSSSEYMAYGEQLFRWTGSSWQSAAWTGYVWAQGPSDIFDAATQPSGTLWHTFDGRYTWRGPAGWTYDVAHGYYVVVDYMYWYPTSEYAGGWITTLGSEAASGDPAYAICAM
jgi:hypothetical protein